MRLSQFARFRNRKHSEHGLGGGELLVGAAVIAIGSFLFFAVWDWIGATVDQRVERARDRNGRLLEADEEVVDRDVTGSYVITFRTG